MKTYRIKATRMVAGNPEPVPETEYARALVEIIRKVRVLCSPDVDKEKYLQTRLAALSERLDDLEWMDFKAEEVS